MWSTKRIFVSVILHGQHEESCLATSILNQATYSRAEMSQMGLSFNIKWIPIAKDQPQSHQSRIENNQNNF